MVGSIKRISADLAALEQSVAELAAEMHSSYSGYLALLGQTVRQQLILASYHACTQGYPEEFLQLSFSQRQQLQEKLKHLAQQVQEELLAQLHVPVVIDDAEADPLRSPANPDAESEPNETAVTIAKREPRSLTPLDLATWQQDLDQAIGDELRTASHAANRLLQQAGILPRHLPEPVLEAASSAEMAQMSSHTPNLLNLLVEATEEEVPENAVPPLRLDDRRESREPREQNIMHIVAIHLRLSEIEFGDAALTVARTKIRNFSGRLKTLRREYRKKQRERAIAEAQAAWRSSWFEG